MGEQGKDCEMKEEGRVRQRLKGEVRREIEVARMIWIDKTRECGDGGKT